MNFQIMLTQTEPGIPRHETQDYHPPLHKTALKSLLPYQVNSVNITESNFQKQHREQCS